MKMHTVTIDVDYKQHPTAEQLEHVADLLAQHHAAFAVAPSGRVTAIVSFPAENVAQAAMTGVALVEAATGHPAVSVEALSSDEHDKRQGVEPLPDLVGVSEAAEILGGVSRQAVLDRINRGTLPAQRVGREYAIPRSALVKR